MIYERLYWDIIGKCNSRCKYCCNGKDSILGKHHASLSGVLSPDDLDRGLDYLIEKNVIRNDKTVIAVYNWGEPFLHPQFETMLSIVAEKGFKLDISTNGSILKRIPEELVSSILYMGFSMPGFNQESYDKIHGFNFETICKNIETMTNWIHSINPNILIHINYHKYTFSINDVQKCVDFCNKLGIGIIPVYAYFGGYTMAKNYYNGKYVLEDDLMIDKLKEISTYSSTEWECPQYSILTLDEYSNVLLCCAVDRNVYGSIIGHMNDVDFNNLYQIKKKSYACKLCSKMKHNFVIHNSYY